MIKESLLYNFRTITDDSLSLVTKLRLRPEREPVDIDQVCWLGSASVMFCSVTSLAEDRILSFNAVMQKEFYCVIILALRPSSSVLCMFSCHA